MVKYEEQEITDVFHALSDPTRRAILRMCAVEDRQATDLAESFSMSFPAVSKHLKVLETANLITREVNGRVHRFRTEARTMKKAYQWIEFYKKFWLGSLDSLNEFVKKRKKENK